MEHRPSIIKKAKVARDVHSLTEQLVQGLIMGGFLGPGLMITKRESHRIEFQRCKGIHGILPSSGELVFNQLPSGETELECRLWCQKIAVHRLIISIFLGVLLASTISFLLNPLIPYSLASGVVAAIGIELIQEHREKVILSQRILTFIHNSNYLMAL